MWQVTIDMWKKNSLHFMSYIFGFLDTPGVYSSALQMTCDKCQVTSDKLHVTCDNIFFFKYNVIYFCIPWDPGVYSSALQVASYKWYVTCDNFFFTHHVIYFRIPDFGCAINMFMFYPAQSLRAILKVRSPLETSIYSPYFGHLWPYFGHL